MQFLVAIVASLALAVVLTLPFAWVAMLLLGALHAQVASVPALGYLPVLLVMLLLRLVLPTNAQAKA